MTTHSEELACGACGATAMVAEASVPDHEYGTGIVVRYASCASCGSLTQCPMPDARTLATFYDTTYHSFAAESRLARWKHQQRWRRIRHWMTSDNDALLDFGCGSGQFLRSLLDRVPHRLFGYEVDGTDRVDELGDGRLTLVRGSLDFLLARLPPVKLITMNHVIEHLPDPAATLHTLRQLLAPGGGIEGQTPNADSLERRCFGTRWSGFHAPRHTVIFSRSGLNHLLERSGATAVRVAGGFNPAGIAVSLMSMRHGDDGGVVGRKGLPWLAALAAASVLHPVERLSGRPGIIDFDATFGA